MRERNIPVQVYLDEKEFRQLDKLSHKTGLNFSAVIRKLLSGAELLERPNRDYRTLSRSVDRIGANINQIAHMANITRSVERNEVQKLQAEFRSLQKEIEVWKKQWL